MKKTLINNIIDKFIKRRKRKELEELYSFAIYKCADDKTLKKIENQIKKMK